MGWHRTPIDLTLFSFEPSFLAIIFPKVLPNLRETSKSLVPTSWTIGRIGLLGAHTYPAGRDHLMKTTILSFTPLGIEIFLLSANSSFWLDRGAKEPAAGRQRRR